MNKLRKFLLYFSIIFLSVGLTYLYVWQKPKLENLLKNYIESISLEESVPFEIKVDQAYFSIFSLQVELYNTHFKPKKKFNKLLLPFNIKKFVLKPKLIDLLIGKFWIHLLQIKDTELNIKISNQTLTDSSGPKNNFPDFNNFLKRIPISEIDIQNVHAKINYLNRYFIEIKDFNMQAFNQKSSLMISIKNINSTLKARNASQKINFLTDIQFLVTKNTIFLSKLKLIKKSSYFLASGNLFYKNHPKNIHSAKIKTRFKSNFQDFYKWSLPFHRMDYLNRLRGNFKIDTNFIKSDKNPKKIFMATTELKSFQIDKFRLGDFSFDADVIDSKLIRLKKFKAVLSGGNKIDIKNGELQLGAIKKIKADVNFQNTQIQSFLKKSNIADVPVWLKINGFLKCEGTYEEKLSIQCPGKLSLKNIQIKNPGRKKNIVSTENISITGSVDIDEEAVNYNAVGTIDQGSFQSKGHIEYEKGFNIDYQFKNMDFSNFGKIADLRFEGNFNCSGKTRGNSRTATFETKVEANDFKFQDYLFGQFKSLLSYKNGTLYLKKINGNMKSTRFKGELSVNLRDEKIKGDIRLPFLMMKNIREIVLEKVDIEDKLTGSGSGRIQIDTSFDINRMSFKINSHLFKGQAFGESYNEAKIKAQSVDGIVILQKVYLKRKKTLFDLKGTIDNEFISDLTFEGTTHLLGNSSLIKKYKLPVTGQLFAKGKIKGPLKKPLIKFQSKLNDLVFNEKKYGEASFNYDNSEDQTRFQFKVKNQLDLNLSLSLNSENEVFINAKSKNFDLAPLMAFFITKEATKSYKIETSSEISGKINKNNLWNSKISAVLEKISLKYRENEINSILPTSVEMKNKQLYISDLNLSGDKQFIKITQALSEKINSKLVINGRINIAFLKILFPFVEKINGLGILHLELILSEKSPKLIGSTYLTRSFLKFPGFPHPFEDLSGDILFNEKRFSINSLSGQIAEGKVVGNGRIEFKKKGEINVNLNTNITDAHIDFPEGFKTQGDASISFSGSGPFLLSGQYNVKGGFIDSSFNSKKESQSTDLLRELLKKEVESPLLINLDIKTEKSIEIKNNLIEGYINADLTVYDKVIAPKIKGEAHFDRKDSLIRFSDNEFEVIDSSFLFDGQNPINPKLSLRAKNRVNGYDIELFLKGRSKKPILTAASHPPLPENQIIAMLTLGTLPDQFQQNNSATRINDGSHFEIGTSILSNNPLGKELKKRLDVDVQFSSAFDDQNNVAVPKVTIRKKITKKLLISVSQTTGQSNQSEGRVTYELNNQLSTIFRVTNFSEQINASDNSNLIRQNNPVGIDLEYNLEFD